MICLANLRSAAGPAMSSPRGGRWLAHLLLVSLALLPLTGHTASRDQAKRIHDRIAGVPPEAAILQAMQDEMRGTENLSVIEGAVDTSTCCASLTR